MAFCKHIFGGSKSTHFCPLFILLLVFDCRLFPVTMLYSFWNQATTRSFRPIYFIDVWLQDLIYICWMINKMDSIVGILPSTLKYSDMSCYWLITGWLLDPFFSVASPVPAAVLPARDSLIHRHALNHVARWKPVYVVVFAPVCNCRVLWLLWTLFWS